MSDSEYRDAIVSAARVIRELAPTSMKRAPGPLGEAWDLMVESLDAIGRPDITEAPSSDDEPEDGGRNVGLVGIVASAARVQAHVDRICDDELTKSWEQFLEAIS